MSEISVSSILEDLYNRNILSVFIEGGAFTLKEFISANLWDEARILTGEVEIKDGIIAPSIEGKLVQANKFGKDQISIYYNNL